MKHFNHKLTRFVQFFTDLCSSLSDNLIDYFDHLIYDSIFNSLDDSEVSNNFLLKFVGVMREMRYNVFESLLFLEDMIKVCQNELSVNGSEIGVNACL